MVGRRHQVNPQAIVGGDDNKTRDDLEQAYGIRAPRSPADRFRDVAATSVADVRRAKLKRLLKEGVDAWNMEQFRKDEDEIKAIKNDKVRKFYEQQNETLNDWLEVDTVVTCCAEGIIDSMNPDADHDGILERSGRLQQVQEHVEELLPADQREMRQRAARNARWAININVIANIALLIAKIIAALATNSLSLLASLVDSALDLLCTVIIWTTSQLVRWRLDSLRMHFPVGRRRLEPIGILVFSVIMVVSFAQILQESVTRLFGEDHEMTEFPPIATWTMVATIVLKSILWVGCIPVKTSQVQALAQDCKNDVYFNGMSLLFPAIGQAAGIWWLDAAGAAALSVYIIWEWSATALENVIRLSGSAVAEPLQQKVAFMCFRFAPLIEGFKSLKCYHAGDGVWVECDLLFNETTPLHRAHDVAETLQYCLEALPEVDRAFVHTDYTAKGPTGHNAQ